MSTVWVEQRTKINAVVDKEFLGEESGVNVLLGVF